MTRQEELYFIFTLLYIRDDLNKCFGPVCCNRVRHLHCWCFDLRQLDFKQRFCLLISDANYLKEKSIVIAPARSEMEQEGEDDLKEKRLKVLAGLKILEQQLGVPIESKTEMDGEKQLKISLDRLEGFRKAWFEGYEKRLSDLKKQREHYKRRRVEAKHSSRKDFLDDLGKLAKELEDGLIMSEENERGLVKDMADATMRFQRDIKQDEVIRDIDEELLVMEDLKSFWASWATM